MVPPETTVKFTEALQRMNEVNSDTDPIPFSRDELLSLFRFAVSLQGRANSLGRLANSYHYKKQERELHIHELKMQLAITIATLAVYGGCGSSSSSSSSSSNSGRV